MQSSCDFVDLEKVFPWGLFGGVAAGVWLTRVTLSDYPTPLHPNQDQRPHCWPEVQLVLDADGTARSVLFKSDGRMC